MLRLRQPLLTALLLLAPAAAPAAGALNVSQEIEAKVALEGALERRLQTLLRRLLGSEEVLVVVNVRLGDSRRERAEVLPGVPVKETPADSASAAAVLTMVQSLSASVFLEDSATDEQVELARATAARLLGLEPRRGDRLTVERMPPVPKGAAAEASGAPSSLLSPALVSLLWLAAALVALAILHAAFLKPLLAVLKDFARARAAPPLPAAPAPPPQPDAPPELAARPEPVVSNGHAEANGKHRPESLPFSFIRERHLPMLGFLLRQSAPRTAAVIIHYLPPRMSAQLLIGLVPEARRRVVECMSRVTQLQEKEVRTVEDHLKARIEYLMGGEDKLVEILNEVPAGVQEELLTSVGATDPSLSDRLGRRIVLLEDLALLTAADLKTLSRRVQLKSLAVVLKAAPALKDTLLPKLAPGLRQWLQQEIDLAADISAEALEVERRKVLIALSGLVREGGIVLRKEHAETSSMPGLEEPAAPGDAGGPPPPAPES